MFKIIFVAALFGLQVEAKEWLGDELGRLGGATVYVADAYTLQIPEFRAPSGSGPFMLMFDGREAGGTYLRKVHKSLKREYLEPIKKLTDEHDGAHIVIMTSKKKRIGTLKRLQIVGPGGRALETLRIRLSQKAAKPYATGSRIDKELYTPYGVGSGRLRILSERSIEVPKFKFLGSKPPDGFLFVGKKQDVLDGGDREAGYKTFVREIDDGKEPKPLRDDYRGEKDLIIDLPEGLEMKDIDIVSVYCYSYSVNFGHAELENIPKRLPAYIPPVIAGGGFAEAWDIPEISGKDTFDVTVGRPGGKRGYEGQHSVRPNRYVFYINGLMAPTLVLKRGKNYKFRIQGGTKYMLYFTNEGSGGYKIEPEENRSKIKVYRKQQARTKRLCRYKYRSRDDAEKKADKYDDFRSFKRAMLKLKCKRLSNKPAVMRWTPGNDEPDNIYYGALDYYNMGGKIKLE